jgi:hypothetical protein
MVLGLIIYYFLKEFHIPIFSKEAFENIMDYMRALRARK